VPTREVRDMTYWEFTATVGHINEWYATDDDEFDTSKPPPASMIEAFKDKL
jgi:hypothetical protein